MGAYPLGVQSFDLTDESRDTPANNEAPATTGRKLPTVVYYPTSGESGADASDPKAATEDATIRDGRFPLLVFSHGVTGRGVFYAGELAALASAGYIVIAPDYPLSNADSPGGPTIADVGNQPEDASYLIDIFTDETVGSTAEKVASHVDVEHIGAVGHSLGAVTSLGIGYASCCADDRVDAVASWAGIFVPLKGEESPSPERSDIPLLLVHGDRDGTVPYGSSVKAFDAVDGPRWFITLPGAGHTPSFVSSGPDPQARVTTTATIDFFDAELKGDPKGIDRLDQTVADAGREVATLKEAS